MTKEWFYGDLRIGLSLELPLLLHQLSLSSSDFWTGEIFSNWYVYYSLCEQDGETDAVQYVPLKMAP